MTKTAVFLRKRREELEISQIDLANQIGYTNQYLSNIERGKCLIPVNMIKSLSSILKINKKKLIDITMEDIREKFYSDV